MANTLEEHVKIIDGANITSVSIDEIEEFSSYEIWVKAFNIYGEGNASEVHRCKTAEDG